MFDFVRKTASRAIATMLLAGAVAGAVVAAPQAASAQCAPEDPIYTFKTVTTSSTATNLHSDYIAGPGSIHYVKTATATVSASMTASVSAEAGIVFAKASTSIGVTVGASYSWTEQFDYTLTVPAGKTARMRLYRESRSFYVTKQVFKGSTCSYVTAYSNQFVNAPRGADIQIWRLEYLTAA